MQDTIFRQYDIRGKVESEFVLEQTYNLTIAIARYLLSQDPQIKKVVVGMDGRVHSPAIKDDMCHALLDLGLEVTFIGICPTPVLYFCMHTMPFDAGLMITASHNTKEYNGIKICLGKRSVAGEEIQEIKRGYQELIALHEEDDTSTRSAISLSMTEIQSQACLAQFHGTVSQDSFLSSVILSEPSACPPKPDGEGWESKGQPNKPKYYNALADYISWLKNHFVQLQNYAGNFVIDCAHGAAAAVIPQLVQEMGWRNAQIIYGTIDGNFPAHEADPTDEKNVHDLRAAIKQHKADFGIGFDGDADRMAPMTAQGQLILGDKMLALFAQDIVQTHPGACAVFDIKCSSCLPVMIKQCGGVPCISATGHSIIKKKMKEEKALLGGELSCHFFFADNYFGYDDGIYAAMRLISLLQKRGATLQELVSVFPHMYATPEIRIACEQQTMIEMVVGVKTHFAQQKDAELMLIDGVRVAKSYGWGLIRASNTQPVICLRFEADSQQHLIKIKEDFKDVLKHYIDEEVLDKVLI